MDVIARTIFFILCYLRKYRWICEETGINRVNEYDIIIVKAMISAEDIRTKTPGSVLHCFRFFNSLRKR